ncbi:MAG: hypothetical protein GF320_10870 [Armatimonadia bacterium]|nr:hypothetical protein [Armatimonadia bacterium]
MFEPLDPMPEQHQPKGLTDKLQNLARKIPGYGGYIDREARRDADKQLRQRVGQHLGEAIDQLQQLSERLSRDMKLDAIGGVDRGIARVRTIQAKVEHADYGAAGIFSQVKIDEQRLGEIYDHDLKLLELADQVVQQSHAVASADEDTMAEKLSELDARVKELENHLVAREHLLTSTD